MIFNIEVYEKICYNKLLNDGTIVCGLNKGKWRTVNEFSG